MRPGRDWKWLRRACTASLLLVMFSAHAQAQSFVLNLEQTLAEGEDLDDFDRPTKALVSPDAKHVYLPTQGSDALFVFSRTGGKLVHVQTLRNGQNGVQGLAGATLVSASPDSRFLYVGSRVDSAVAVFERNPTSGLLTYVHSVTDGGDGGDFLEFILVAAVSPDGMHVYAPSLEEDAVTVFDRDPDTGRLTFSSVAVNGLSGVTDLFVPTELAFSPDGLFCYITVQSPGGLVVFARDPDTGALTFVQSFIDDGFNSLGLQGTIDVEVSADGRFVYVDGTSFDGLDSGAVVTFERDLSTGQIEWLDVVRSSDPGLGPMLGPDTMVLDPVNDQIVVSAFVGDAVVIFNRDDTSGLLSLDGIVQRGVDVSTGMDGPVAAVSPDGFNIYVSGVLDNTLLSFRRVAGIIEGTVVDEEGMPVTCAAVLARPVAKGGAIERLSTTDLGGRYRIAGIPLSGGASPDDYELIVFAPGFQELTVLVEGDDFDPVTGVAEDAEGNPEIELALTTAGAGEVISGQVTDADNGVFLGGVRVTLVVDGVDDLVTFTCAEGRYELPVAAKGEADTEVRFNAPDYVSQTLDASSGEVDAGLEKAFDFPNMIIGSVTEQGTDDPVEDARVTAGLVDGVLSFTLDTPASGAFSFTVPDTGEYQVTASAEAKGEAARGVLITDAQPVATADMQLGDSPLGGGGKGGCAGGSSRGASATPLDIMIMMAAVAGCLALGHLRKAHR